VYEIHFMAIPPVLQDGHEVNLIHLWMEVPDGNAGSVEDVEDVEEEVCNCWVI
jgi:hypothetical protein